MDINLENKKSHDYFFIIDISDNFFQLWLWHSGQTNIVVSNPSKYSSGIIKSLSHFLQWFIVITFFTPYIIRGNPCINIFLLKI